MRDLAALPGDTWIEVRLDQLIADPAGEIRRVATFCEVEDVEHLVSRATPLVDPSPDCVFESIVSREGAERARQLFAADLALIRERIRPLQTKLGYAVE